MSVEKVADMIRLVSIWSIACLTLLLALGCAAASPGEPPEVPAGRLDPMPAQQATSPDAAPATGTGVGDRVPDFAINLADGSTVTSTELIDQGRPTFLFFFATW